MGNDLSFFVLLARLESFTATGRELGISASAVSRRLVKLEDRLGVRLLHRTTRRVSLTSEGDAYLLEAERILGDIDALEQRITGARDTPKGLLRINSTLRFGRTFIAPAISTFKQRYPEVEVQLLLTDAPLNLVKEGVDLGIRFGAPPDSRMVLRLLVRNRRYLCAAPSYLSRRGFPATLGDLQEHNCIVLRQDHGAYDIWRFDDRNGDMPTAKVGGDLSTNDGEIALDWVLGGHGIMLRSEWDIASHVRQGNLRIVLPNYRQSAHLSAVYPERHNLSAKVRRFVDHLADTLKETGRSAPLTLSPKYLETRP
ncbi:LysR substrate-binding domain-containing protein [Nisaea acidiphila]|uniref:LysR substrate-binding domain-containing protein n=1 Tax=Nisaea acidiphila TaxID=1862145 RepID=A0A9J7ANA4_9PROT|nr:LysR substrate-binding domain-containing protein [Nisaea acidiphila]UUX48920.1 LysR substrate-binding domain-containing protein [Nisaea acidiphila]